MNIFAKIGKNVNEKLKTLKYITMPKMKQETIFITPTNNNELSKIIKMKKGGLDKIGCKYNKSSF